VNSPLSTRHRFSIVLFDLDGTLVDSNDAHAPAWVRAFAEAAIRVRVPPRRLERFGLHGALAIYDEPADLLGRRLDSPLISNH